jgi:hypothetical protein
MAFALAALIAGATQAQTAPTPTELRLGLVGRWTGALGYRDYQTDQLFELPVATAISSPGDGATLIRQSLFDDGPNNPVWITTVSLDDVAAATATSASYRAGRTVSLSTESLSVAAFTDPTHWTVVYSQVGEDDDAPAEIRVTETRDGDSLLEVKDVRPVGAGDDAWRFRNQTRLTRVGD